MLTLEEIDYLKALKEAARAKSGVTKTRHPGVAARVESQDTSAGETGHPDKASSTKRNKPDGLPKGYQPSEAELKRYLEKWDTLGDYVEHEKALSMIFRENPEFSSNNDLRHIIIKCSALNDFYATKIYRVAPVARKIYDIEDFDERLAHGDDALIEEIASVDGRRNYSFATKYCSHHQPELYPIFDRYVAEVLDELRIRNPTTFSFRSKKALTDYPTFRKAIDEFRAAYNLLGYSYKDVDRYLWQLGKDFYNPYAKKISISKPIIPMAVKTTAAGKMDKRTKEYKELKERLAKARAAKAKTTKPAAPQSKLKKTASGKVDKRTKEGKAIAERMAKARKAKNSLANRLKRLFR